MRKLTGKECKASQRRTKNGYGDRWPYKGYNYDHTEAVNLPKGWVFIFIPTWGVHIRQAGDEDYTKDL